MNKNADYSKYFSSPELLANAVLEQYRNEIGNIEFPINPFKILKSLDVKLVIKSFKDLEGLYIPATSEEDIDIVAINLYRPLHRQRFTAAHEICHCIKDKQNAVICPINDRKNVIEKFAENFAGCLLMPTKELEKQVKKYANENGYIDLEKVIYISEYFGVSFESCVFSIAYRLNRLDGEIEIKKLRSRIRKIKVDKLREEFGIKNNLELTREIVDFYCYARPENAATNIKFKQYLVLNENRLENVDVTEEQINFILADLRLNNNYEKYGNDENPNILEALGNIELMEYVLNTDEKIDIWKLQKMQRLLYKYTPHGHELPFPRQENNRINGAEVSTMDYKLIPEILIEVGKQMEELLNKKDFLSIHEYVREAIQIHHRLTVIHPLVNGNGRCGRAMLLWLLRLKNIPPIYISSEDKAKYITALNKIDIEGEYDYLELLVLEQIIKSMIIFDEKLAL